MLNSPALTPKVRFWSTSPLCSWHSFQCGKTVVPEFWYIPGVDPPSTAMITDHQSRIP